MTDTRPGELSRNEARRIAQETADLLKIADNERTYREHVLVSLVRLETKMDALQASFEKHVDEDDQRFGSFDQRIYTNSSSISKGAGIVAAVVAMIGAIMFIIDRVTP